MHRKLSVFAVFLFLSSGLFACRNTYESARPYQVYPQEQTFFSGVINESETSEHLVTIHEDKYPISIKLYKDGRFSYTLRKLGDGWGKWKYSAADGYIDLYAERAIFVMQMQLRAVDPANPSALALEFSDRFGPKYLSMTTK